MLALLQTCEFQMCVTHLYSNVNGQSEHFHSTTSMYTILIFQELLLLFFEFDKHCDLLLTCWILKIILLKSTNRLKKHYFTHDSNDNH